MNLQDILESAGYEVQSYSGRGMFGNYCLAVRVSSLTDLFADILDLDDFSSCDFSEIADAFRSSEVDSLGRDTLVYFPNISLNENRCQHEYLPDEDGTVYTCGESLLLKNVDGIYLCKDHRND